MINGDNLEFADFYQELVMKKYKLINPVVFLDLTNSRENKQHLSWTNHSEIDLIIYLISHLIWLAGNNSGQLKKNIGIITPYRGQVRAIKRKWQDYHVQFNFELNDIRIDTVDSF
jgi:superfamily I DNA and/or RNA helicase